MTRLRTLPRAATRTCSRLAVPLTLTSQYLATSYIDWPVPVSAARCSTASKRGTQLSRSEVFLTSPSISATRSRMDCQV